MSVQEEGDRAAAADRRPLRTVALIVYGSLAALLLIMPGALESRLDDFEPTPAVKAARAVVDMAGRVSAALRLEQLYPAARQRFLNASGLQHD